MGPPMGLQWGQGRRRAELAGELQLSSGGSSGARRGLAGGWGASRGREGKGKGLVGKASRPGAIGTLTRPIEHR